MCDGIMFISQIKLVKWEVSETQNALDALVWMYPAQRLNSIIFRHIVI